MISAPASYWPSCPSPNVKVRLFCRGRKTRSRTKIGNILNFRYTKSLPATYRRDTQRNEKSYRQELAVIKKTRMIEMVRFKSSMSFVVLMVFIGCGAIERPVEAETNQAEPKEKQRSLSVPTFIYRPGAGLMIEGR